MLDEDNARKVEKFISKIQRLTLDTDDEARAILITAAANYLATNPFFHGTTSCPKFMENRFDSVINTNLSEDSHGKIKRILFDISLMCKECMMRSGQSGDPLVKVLRYYHTIKFSEGENINEEEFYKIYLDNYDCFDTKLLEDEYKNISSHSDNWFGVKKQILDNEFSKQHEDLSQMAERIEKLRDEANKAASTFNLAGLTHGFEEMLRKVTLDKNIQILALLLLGSLITAIPIAIIASSDLQTLILPTYEQATTFQIVKFYSLKIAPIIFIEAILIYYFRVILHQYNSSKGQIAQLQLRRALCKFIEEHAEFKKGKDSAAFEKFDSIIFSPIVTNQEKIPSTLDGIDSLIKLVSQAYKTQK